MSKTKVLSPMQNERLRLQVQLLLEKTSQSVLAPQLGLTQAALSQFVSGKTGASLRFAEAVAKHKNWDVLSLLTEGETRGTIYLAKTTASRAGKALSGALAQLEADIAKGPPESVLVRDVQLVLMALEVSEIVGENLRQIEKRTSMQAADAMPDDETSKVVFPADADPGGGTLQDPHPEVHRLYEENIMETVAASRHLSKTLDRIDPDLRGEWAQARAAAGALRNVVVARLTKSGTNPRHLFWDPQNPSDPDDMGMGYSLFLDTRGLPRAGKG